MKIIANMKLQGQQHIKVSFNFALIVYSVQEKNTKNQYTLLARAQPFRHNV